MTNPRHTAYPWKDCESCRRWSCRDAEHDRAKSMWTVEREITHYVERLEHALRFMPRALNVVMLDRDAGVFYRWNGTSWDDVALPRPPS